MQAVHATPETVTARIESAFAAIQRERMTGVPILNPALAVAAIGAQPWGEDWLAILVTPWCMNILLLPGAPENPGWSGLKPGATARRALPSGEYSFILGEEPALGRFLMCSLFSPMLQFTDQAAALATAEAALAELMTPVVKPAPATPQGLSRRNLFGFGGEGIEAAS